MIRRSISFLAVALVSMASLAGSVSADMNETAYKFSFQSIDESEMIELVRYRDKPVLVVNTASFCGFTPQYSGLETLWQSYKDRGLVVLGVPSNDFGGQEPKAEKEIQEFCQGGFGITFPLTKKYRVNGPRAHAFYQWVDTATQGAGSPRWNFHKILVGADGKIAEWFASSAKPNSARVRDAIEKELQRVAGSM